MVPISDQLTDGAVMPLASFGRKVINMDGESVPDPAGTAKLEYLEGPDVRIHSGRIVACDAYLAAYQPVAFIRELPIDAYPVQVIVAHGIREKRNAFAMLRVEERPAVRWEPAFRAGEKVRECQSANAPGYGVDFATGCFTDLETARAIDPTLSPDAGMWRDLSDRLPDSYGLAEVSVRSETGWNLVGFPSGYGDGGYASYWGFAADNQPVCLVTDFDVVQTSAFDTAFSKAREKSGVARLWKRLLGR